MDNQDLVAIALAWAIMLGMLVLAVRLLLFIGRCAGRLLGKRNGQAFRRRRVIIEATDGPNREGKMG